MFVQIIITTIIVILVFFLPSVYDISSFVRVYDLFAIVGREFAFTQPQNIVSKYFPSPNLQIQANVTYSVDTTTNNINMKINNINYTLSLDSLNTEKIVIPIILGAV